MGEKTKIFLLLLKKNFLVRKKHWAQSVIVQIVIPIVLFLIGEIIYLMIDSTPTRVPHHTYYEIRTQSQLLSDVSMSGTYIRYTPQNSFTNKLMKSTRECLKLQATAVNGSKDEDTLIAELQRDFSTSEYPPECVGIVFESFGNSTLLKYKLRVSSLMPSELFDSEENSIQANFQFLKVPLVQVQMCLDQSYINLTVPEPKFHIPEITIQQMPYPPYIKVDKDAVITGDTFAELARLVFLIILCVEISFPANEKFIGINILMSVNGLKTRMNLLSWLVSGAIYSTSYLLPIVLLLKHFMPPRVRPFLLYGDAFIVWIALFIHACHVFTFGYHISSYFWKPSHGIFVTFMVTTLMNILAIFVRGYTVERFFLYAGIFSPNFILKKIFSELTDYESKLTGIHWSNLFTTGSNTGAPEGSIGVLIIFSILGIIFHFFMTISVYNVFPGKYGIRRSPFYCFQQKKSNKVDNNENEIIFENIHANKKEFEVVPEGTLEPGIRIRRLKKTYTTDWFRNTKVYALKGVSLDFYKSQITALLGHNGAGKTTMMSILSGLTDSTEGVIFINGKNITTNPDVISSNIGLCPQENIVFPDLNVHQQLMFFGTLKGKTKTKSQLEHEIDLLLSKVNLTDKKYAFPNQLSGGQKRRLCLAMAVVGDASVLILDEPTSGMDAESKREVWDIILKMRGEKTIIISTHDMEEADILGDRISIMHSGKTKCYGTSMFLKKLYGNGHIEITLSTEDWFDVTNVSHEIGVTVQVVNQNDGKTVLIIPHIDNLPQALDKLESSKKQLGITGISVSMITLEQVFLQVTRENNDVVDSSDPVRSFDKNQGFAYYAQTFKGFLIKKIIFAHKNPWNILISLLLPCFAAVLILLDHGVSSGSNKSTPLTLDNYYHSIALVHTENNIFGTKYRDTIEYFKSTANIVSSNLSLTDSLLRFATNDLSTYRNKLIVSAEFNGTNDNIKANGFYSGSALLSVPITINCITNTLIKVLTNNSNYRIEASAQSLPDIDKLKQAPMLNTDVTLSMIVFLAPAIAMYVTQPLTESLSGIKQLQIMTGAPTLMYWGATFLFDIMQYITSVLLLLVTFVSIDKTLGTEYYQLEEILIFIGLLILFGISVLPFVYLTSFLKKTLNSTIIALCVAPLVLTAIELILFAFSMELKHDAFKIFRKIQSNLFLLIPHVSFIYGHLSFHNALAQNARCRRMPNKLLEVSCISGMDPCCGMDCFDGVCKKPLSYFDELHDILPSLRKSMIYLSCLPIIFFTIISLLELKLFGELLAIFRRRKVNKNIVGIDEMVLKEKFIVNDEISRLVKKVENNLYQSENIFLVQELEKYYGRFHAVKGITFRVREGECFGLLGVNGAGKSTTFRMLTGDSIQSNGTIYLKDSNISTDRVKYLMQMGYCPQQDALIDTFNSWDHLNLFAKLRGIPDSQIDSTVHKWISKLNLTACASQPSGTYSGGNKRRLNIAIALIGNPPLVLMDEPTTGVDPAARRSLWNTLKACQSSGQSIILTSHSMEECEALCNRLVIMVGGQLVCVGASQELKQRFGAGYNIHIKLSPNHDSSHIDLIKIKIESNFTCKLTDENTGFIGYHITDLKVTWTAMYTVMNELKNDFNCIEDFVVLSSTLEQLFIQFARAPADNTHQLNGVVTESWKKQTNESGL